jgi:hypothetical protein
MSRVRIAVVMWTAVVLGAAGIGHALDCGGRLVLDGASPWDVQSICGDPMQVNDTIKIVLKPAYSPQGRVYVPVGVPNRRGPITSGRRGSCLFSPSSKGRS